MSYEEIAETLEVNPGTVRSRLFSARRLLIEGLERGMKPMKHVDEETLFMYMDGELPFSEAKRVKEHLAGCPECRALLKEYGMVSEGFKEEDVSWDTEAFTRAVMEKVNAQVNGVLLERVQFRERIEVQTQSLVATHYTSRIGRPGSICPMVVSAAQPGHGWGWEVYREALSSSKDYQGTILVHSPRHPGNPSRLVMADMAGLLPLYLEDLSSGRQVIQRRKLEDPTVPPQISAKGIRISWVALPTSLTEVASSSLAAATSSAVFWACLINPLEGSDRLGKSPCRVPRPPGHILCRGNYITLFVIDYIKMMA